MELGKMIHAGRTRLLRLSIALTALPGFARIPAPDWLPAERPEDLGWSAPKLEETKQYSRGLSTESVMIVDYSGPVVHQWGDVTRAVDVFSIPSLRTRIPDHAGHRIRPPAGQDFGGQDFRVARREIIPSCRISMAVA